MKQVTQIGYGIVSPIGMTAEETFSRLLGGESALRRWEGIMDIPEPFTASLLDENALAPEYGRLGLGPGYTLFEKRAILSAEMAIEKSGIDPSSDRVQFIVSTTKGNAELLDSRTRGNFPPERELPGAAARTIAGYFGNKRSPIVVSNACISGLSAQICGMRQLLSGCCDYVVIIGADVQSRFIISGFQSFKALSPEPCRPFDAARNGLNAGEASATIIYGLKEPAPDEWVLVRGAIRNDANHISGPSRTGEGSFRALDALGLDSASLAFVNVHGTATVYNDEMESIALDRAGLTGVPVNGLKGVFGHTMGAAGVLEVILSMMAADRGLILPMRGYSESGVSRPQNISAELRHTDLTSFVKLLSGFGGCNAAALFKKGGEA